MPSAHAAGVLVATSRPPPRQKGRRPHSRGLLGRARGLLGVEGAEPLASRNVRRCVCWLEHVCVAQASRRTSSKRAVETNSSRSTPDTRRRDAGRGTPPSQSPEQTMSATVRWPQKPFIGGGRSSGCDLASLPSAPATSSAAIPFDPTKSGSFLHIGSDTETVMLGRNMLSHKPFTVFADSPGHLRDLLPIHTVNDPPLREGWREATPRDATPRA